jgi:hypothetical protein
MLIFTIIIFGLATIRTIVPLVQNQNSIDFVSSIILATTMIITYIWFLSQFVKLV